MGRLAKYTICLDYPGLPYRPGDTVTGSVHIPANDTDVEWIQVTLKATVKYSVAKSISASENGRKWYNAVLFFRDHIVTQDTDSRKWRFAVVIPAETENTNVAENTYTLLPEWAVQEGGFTTEPKHALPPATPRLDGATALGAKYRHCAASVAYSLQTTSVKLKKKPEPAQPKQRGQAGTPFWVTSLCLPSSFDPSDRSNETKKGFNLLLQNHSAKGAKKRSASTSATKAELAVSAPTYVHVGDSVEISMRLTLIDRHVRDLSLDQLSITLQRFTVELRRKWRAYSPEASLSRFVDAAVPPSNLLGVDKFELCPTSELSSAHQGPIELVASPALPKFTYRVSEKMAQPDFSTFHLSVRHQLRAIVQFDSHGTSSQCETLIPIQVLPKPRRPGTDGDTEGFVEGPQDIKEDWGPLLISGGHVADMAVIARDMRATHSVEQTTDAIATANDLYTAGSAIASLAGVSCLCNIL